MSNSKRMPFSEITRRLESKSNCRQTPSISSVLGKALFDQTKRHEYNKKKLPSLSRQFASHHKNDRNSQLITSINKSFNAPSVKPKSSIDISRITKSSFKAKRSSNPEASFAVFNDNKRGSPSTVSTSKTNKTTTTKKSKAYSKRNSINPIDSDVSETSLELEGRLLSKPLSSQFETQLTKIKTIDSVLNYDQPIKSWSKLGGGDNENRFVINNMIDFGKTFKIISLENKLKMENEKFIVGLMLIKELCWVNLKIGNTVILGNDCFEHEWNGKKIKFYYRWFKVV